MYSLGVWNSENDVTTASHYCCRLRLPNALTLLCLVPLSCRRSAAAVVTAGRGGGGLLAIIVLIVVDGLATAVVTPLFRSDCNCSSPQLSSSASTSRCCESSAEPVDEHGVSAGGGCSVLVGPRPPPGALTLPPPPPLLAGIRGGSDDAATVRAALEFTATSTSSSSSSSSLSSSSDDVAVSLVGDATMTGGGPRLIGTAGSAQDGFAGSGGGRVTPLTTDAGGKHSRTVWKTWSGLINVHNARTAAFGRREPVMGTGFQGFKEKRTAGDQCLI